MKEMGVKKPEVGDVWQNGDLILYIDRISKDKKGKDIIYAYDMDKKDTLQVVGIG